MLITIASVIAGGLAFAVVWTRGLRWLEIMEGRAKAAHYWESGE